MVALPKRPDQEVIDRIYDAIFEADKKPELYLGRLGSSFIGNDCIRAVWLSWRVYAESEFGGRMLRLFGTGHWQEDRIVSDLRRAGFQVWDKGSEGNQFEYVDETGHFITKMDGVFKGWPSCADVPHVLEIKTHNKNSFSGVQKHGVQKSKPLHYSQVQTSLMLSGMTRAVYVAVCKDDEQFYVERIKEDKSEQKLLGKRIISIVGAKMPPAGISVDGEAFGCKFCDMKEVCTGRVTPLKTCRSCRASTAVERGEWRCELHDKLLSKDEQRAACAEYEVL